MSELDKDLRGRVMQALHGQYPSWVSFRLLHVGLTGAGVFMQMADLRKALQYLAEKGFVELREIDSEKISIRVQDARCTAHGVNLIEGDVTDPGIVL